MALSQTYADFATGNDYKGASFVDGAYTSATKTLVKAGAFAATKVNHWLYLESNDGGSIVAGYYKVATWTDADTVILATDAGAGVDDDAAKCTQHDGTTLLPWRSVQGALDLITRDATNGDQVNVKAGTTQVNVTTLSLTTYGTPSATVPLVIRGYTAAANDGGVGVIDCGGATFIGPATLDAITLIDLEIHSAGDNHAVYLDDYCAVLRCYVHQGASSPINKYAILLGDNCVVAGCRVPAYGTGTGADISSAATGRVVGNYVISHNIGILAAGADATIQGNLIYAPGNTGGISATNAKGWIAGNAVFAAVGSTGDGIIAAGATAYFGICMNNILVNFSGAGGAGINYGGLDMLTAGHNAFYNCATNNDSKGDVLLDLTANDVALAADPFTDAANGDFSLTAAAKAALGSLGWPSSYLGAHANTDPHITIGAIQLQATAADYPAEADVEFGVTYDSGGQTGTLVIPAEADVEFGVDYGAAAEFTGAFVVPAVADVQSAVEYGAAAEFTGTFTAPDAADVRSGETYGGSGTEYTGTAAIPTAANVRFGTAVDATTGTMDLPAVADVQQGVQFDGATKTGTFAAPAVADVQSGVGYGAAGTEYTGTFTAPAVADVQSGVQFGGGGTEYTGTFTEPGVGNVEANVQYGGGGVEFTGTFAVPAEAAVTLGTGYGAGGVEFTGTLALADYPAEADVEAGVVFGGAAFTGTFVVPAEGDVQEAVTYGDSAEFTGTLDVPAVTDVKLGVTYGAAGSEFTGTYEASTTVNAITSGNVTTIQGDDYDSADGRQLDWTVASTATLTGGTVAVIIPGVATYTGSVTSETNVRLELTAAQTAAIPVGKRKYQVIVTQTVALGSDVITVVEGTWNSKARVSE